MKIAIVVYSISGHTLRAALRLEGVLAAAGHTPSIMRLETVGPLSVFAENAPLKDPPALNGFDGVGILHSGARRQSASTRGPFLAEHFDVELQKVCMSGDTFFFGPSGARSRPSRRSGRPAS